MALFGDALSFSIFSRAGAVRETTRFDLGGVLVASYAVWIAGLLNA
jgi:hypothetical protein